MDSVLAFDMVWLSKQAVSENSLTKKRASPFGFLRMARRSQSIHGFRCRFHPMVVFAAKID